MFAKKEYITFTHPLNYKDKTVMLTLRGEVIGRNDEGETLVLVVENLTPGNHYPIGSTIYVRPSFIV